MRKHKKGWIRIIEAFVALLIIMGALLVINERGYIFGESISKKVYEEETAILRDIQSDPVLRENIIDATPLPVEWINFTGNLENLKNNIINKTPDYLNCSAKICSLADSCLLSNIIEENIYVKSVIITTDLEVYDPRKLVLFCWEF